MSLIEKECINCILLPDRKEAIATRIRLNGNSELHAFLCNIKPASYLLFLGLSSCFKDSLVKSLFKQVVNLMILRWISSHLTLAPKIYIYVHRLDSVLYAV